MSATNSFHKLESSELRGFDRDARELILAAMAAGGVGRISSKGHAILRAPSGATMSVSRNQKSHNRASQNTTAQYRRLFSVVATEAAPVVYEDVTTTPAEQEASMAKRVKYPCSVPGCTFVAKAPQGLAAHVRMTHEHRMPVRKKKEAPMAAEVVEAAVAEAAVAHTEDGLYEQLVHDIRKLLPASSREAELEEALARAHARIEELEAKFALMKEALEV